jgi:hypothetical protein
VTPEEINLFIFRKKKSFVHHVGNSLSIGQMTIYNSTGIWNLSQNASFAPSQSQWRSTSSSSTDRTSDLQLLSTNGAYVVPASGRYRIVYNCNDSAFVGGRFFMTFTPMGGTSFVLNTSTAITAGLQWKHIMSFQQGDTLQLSFILTTTTSITYNAANTNTHFLEYYQIPSDIVMPVFYRANAGMPPTLITAPQLHFWSGTIKSGFQDVVPITVDGTTTGWPVFRTIIGAFVTPIAVTATTSIANALKGSVDPFPTDNKTITVNITAENTINTLIAGSSPTARNPPVGTGYTLGVIGNY